MRKYDKPKYKCPVCNFKGLYEPAYDERGVGSDDICLCCGFQFGLDDFEYDCKEEAHEVWRRKWIKEGCNWTYSQTNKPKDWNSKEQLKEINIDLDDDVIS